MPKCIHGLMRWESATVSVSATGRDVSDSIVLLPCTVVDAATQLKVVPSPANASEELDHIQKMLAAKPLVKVSACSGAFAI